MARLSFALAPALLAATPVLAAPSAVDVVGRLHFPLLHFPIALLFAVALLELVVRRGDLIQRRAFIGPLLVTAALVAVQIFPIAISARSLHLAVRHTAA